MSRWGVDTSITHPTRTPFVRDRSFIASRPPVPDEYFDRVQDHLVARAQAALGWGWSAATEDFDNDVYPTGYVGDLRLLQGGFGVTAAPAGAADLTLRGDYGVWKFLSGGLPYFAILQSAPSNLGGGDFLWTARVKVLARAGLNVLGDLGFHLGLSQKADSLPAFAAGSDVETWHVFARERDDVTPLPAPRFFDTGVPLRDGRWYELQISRVRGAVRWAINGALVHITVGGELREGIYLPDEMSPARRYLQIRRWAGGPPGDGFHIDYFHCFRKRG